MSDTKTLKVVRAEDFDDSFFFFFVNEATINKVHCKTFAASLLTAVRLRFVSFPLNYKVFSCQMHKLA